MKNLEITSVFESLVNLIIPNEKQAGGLYIRLHDTEQIFSHIIILKDNEKFCIIIEQNSVSLYNQGGKMSPTTILQCSTKNELIEKLIELSFLEEKEYSLNVIREVQHIFLNEFDSLNEESVLTLERCSFDPKMLNIH